MIRVILQGRTGNNLFQFAAGRALSIKHNTNLVLDGSWADARHARQFEQLWTLPINASYLRRLTLAKRTFARFLHLEPDSFHSGPVYKESSLHPDEAFSQMPDDSLLIGFFQSYRYFEGIEGILRSELDPSHVILPTESIRFEEDLKTQPTISLHVRRGDYVAIASTRCIGENYYQSAIEHFRERIPGLRFCIFSDDILWCRKQFQNPEFLFCDLPGSENDPFHDMRLMAACSYHIIANSSYSWWGAWLNPSPGKIVIAPAMWMEGLSSKAVVPPEWIRI